MKRVMVLVSLVVLTLAILQPLLILGQDVTYAGPDPAIIQDIFTRENNLRARRGLPSLRFNAALMAAAQDQAVWLVATGIRTHIRPNGSRPSTRATAAGYVTTDWCCGENYYMSIDATPDLVWNFWTWSSHHYANLVNPRFDEVSIGMSDNGRRYSYVMVFGNAPDSAAPPTPVPQAATASPTQGEYVVQQSDTLLRIARRFGLSMDTIATANGLVNPSLIYPGQQLVIPGAAATTVSVPAAIPPTPVPQSSPPQPPIISTGSEQTYTVQPGENLFRIALRYGTTVQAIMAANGLDSPNRVYAGQQLVIPGAGSAAAIAPHVSGGCSGFQATSPLDGYHNGPTTFYWDPAPGSVGGYQVEVFNESGQLAATFPANANATTVTGDMSEGRIGRGLTFSWDVVALVNGQPVCASQRITAPRENSAP